jgi:quercetin dioxygenase-like cupin family protein
MRKFPITLAVLVIAISGAAAYAQTAPTILMPQQVKWSTSGMPKGVALATVGGNPDGTGMYVQRIKMDAGATFSPHTHGKTEMVTVLSGTLWAGIGTKMDKAKMKPLPAGTFVVMPAGVPHYVMAKGPVVIEISGMGPSTTKMLNGQNVKM